MTIAVFTTTRAEFSIYRPLLEVLRRHEHLSYLLFVGGSHLSDSFGGTVEEIRKSGLEIAATFPYLEESHDPASLAKGLATATEAVAAIFERFQFDLLCVVGDRYEILALLTNAILFSVPVLHVHGGERTEGAIDEQVRHMATKASHIHAVACEEYRKNVLALGEEPWRVHVTGALGIDQLRGQEVIPRSELLRELDLDTDSGIAVLTYHPVTLDKALSHADQVDILFKALEEYDGQVVVTLPNADAGYEEVAGRTRLRASKKPGCRVVSSLGSQRYLSLVRYCDFVIGNSSSAIIEVPYLRVPSIDIGDRQKGRFKHPSVLSVSCSVDEIRDAIRKAMSAQMAAEITNMKFEFGEGDSSHRIVSILEDLPTRDRLLKKCLHRQD